MSKWFETSKRGYLLDFQVPDSFDQVVLGQQSTLRNIDPARIVEQLKDAGVTALYTHARDYPGNCYYNTKVGHKHTGIGDRDLLREFSRACRDAGMAILYYLYTAHSHDPRGSGDPEKDFARVGPDGAPTRDHFICMNRPGREYIKALLRELSTDYDFDGFWLDCYCWAQGKPVCYCDICRSKFYEDTRLQLPQPDDQESVAWRAYIQWIRRQNTQVRRELNEVIRSANPDLTIAYNGGLRFRDPHTDFEGWEVDDYLVNEFHHSEGIGMLSLDCLRNAAMKPGMTFEVEIWRFFMRHNRGMKRANQVKPVPQLFTEMATILAHGGMVQYYDQILMDGSVDWRSMEVLKGAFAEVERREPFLPSELKRVPYASILWSKQTEGFAPHPMEHKQAIRGFHFALMETGLPHQILTGKALREGRFDDTKVVVMPGVTCLSEEEAHRLRTYVTEGGGLVATYRTSLQDGHGNPRENFLLADLFGADYREALSYRYGFMKFPEGHVMLEDLPLDWPMSVFDQLQLKVGPRDTAQGLGNIVLPFRGNKMGYFPGEDTADPAVVLHEIGKGRVVYFPQPLGLCYDAYGHPDTRQLLMNAVRWAAGEAPPVEIRCPDTIERVFWESPSGDKHAIHLINRTAGNSVGSGRGVIKEAIPVHDIRLLLRGSVGKAVQQPEGLELEVSMSGGVSEIVVPRLDIYSIVLVDLSKPRT